jgi:protein phosphatase
MRSEREVAEALIVREESVEDHTYEHGPFDVIGDIHGCCSELETLLTELGYVQVGQIGDVAIGPSRGPCR